MVSGLWFQVWGLRFRVSVFASPKGEHRQGEIGFELVLRRSSFSWNAASKQIPQCWPFSCCKKAAGSKFGLGTVGQRVSGLGFRFGKLGQRVSGLRTKKQFNSIQFRAVDDLLLTSV